MHPLQPSQSNSIIITLTNPRFLDLKVNYLKRANVIGSCLSYQDCLLFEMEEFLVHHDIHGQSILLVHELTGGKVLSME